MQSADRSQKPTGALKSFASRIRGSYIEALLLVLLVAIVCVVSWPGMSSPRILDDRDQLLYIEHFQSWKECFTSDCFDLFRPLKNLTFYLMQDADNSVWHTFTLSCYIFGILGVYAMLRCITACKYRAFLGGLLWATCPTQTVIAVWMSAHNISVSVGLSCICVAMHHWSRAYEIRNHGKFGVANGALLITTCLIMFLAQICYETAVATAGFCLLVDLLRKRSIFSREAIVRYGCYALVTVIFIAMRFTLGATYSAAEKNMAFHPDLEKWKLTVSAPWFMWKHFSMWVMPIGRIEFCSAYLWGKSASMLELAAAWVFVILMFVVIVLTWKRLRMVSIGLAWFFIAAFPSSNFVPISSGPVEDYYVVFPSVGLVLVVLGLVDLFLKWMRQSASGGKRLVGGSLLLLLLVPRLALIPVFWLQADLWNRPTELYLRMIQTRPYQFQLMATASLAFLTEDQYLQAEKLAREAYEIGPWHASSGIVLGTLHLKRGEMEEAQTYFREVMKQGYPGAVQHDYCRLNLARTMKGRAPLEEVRAKLLPLLYNRRGDYHIASIILLVECYMEHDLPEKAMNAARMGVKFNPEDPHLQQLLKSLEASVGKDPVGDKSAGDDSGAYGDVE
ncbi:MAG: hypothetical protein R3242_10845 [Akkermansiaceae bacterium]|nr:hypothetical protein [Akkermansiaceae bacterium]